MADSNSKVSVDVEIALVRDDTAKANENLKRIQSESKAASEQMAEDSKEFDKANSEGVKHVVGGGKEMAEGLEAPQRELRILASQLGGDIPGATDAMRSAFSASAEPMLAVIFAIIGALEVLKAGQEKLHAAILEGVVASDTYEKFQEKLADTLKNQVSAAAADSAIHLEHLHDSYDEFARKIKIATDAASQQEEALKRVNTAMDDVASAQTRMREAEGVIGPVQAKGEERRQKLQAERDKQKLQNEDDKKQIKEKNDLAQQADSGEFDLRQKLTPQGEQGKKQADIDAELESAKQRAELAKNLNPDAEKKAQDMRAQLKEFQDAQEHASSRAAYTIEHPFLVGDMTSGKFEKDTKAAEAQAGHLTELDNHIKELENQKKAIDENTKKMTANADALDKHAQALRDDAADIQARMLKRMAADAVADAHEERASIMNDVADSFTELRRLMKEKQTGETSKAIKELTEHLKKDAEQDAADKESILKALQDIRRRTTNAY